jgi:hypothetical protein
MIRNVWKGLYKREDHKKPEFGKRALHSFEHGSEFAVFCVLKDFALHKRISYA